MHSKKIKKSKLKIYIHKQFLFSSLITMGFIHPMQGFMDMIVKTEKDDELDHVVGVRCEPVKSKKKKSVRPSMYS